MMPDDRKKLRHVMNDIRCYVSVLKNDSIKKNGILISMQRLLHGNENTTPLRDTS